MELIGNSFISVSTALIVSNYKAVQSHVGAAVTVMPVVKANAYGHGLIPAVQTLVRHCGVRFIGVGQVIEALQLIEAGISPLPDIMVLGGVPSNNLPYAVSHGLILPVFSPAEVNALSKECERQGRTVRVHIKVDTGLGRIGVKAGSELELLLQALKQSPSIQVDGVYTHFSDAAAEDPSYTEKQLKLFQQATEQIRAAGFSPVYIHAADTSAMMRFPQTHFNLVRTGLSWLGYDLCHKTKSFTGLTPAIHWQAYITRIHCANTGSYVGYAQSIKKDHFTRPTAVATISVGSADGMPRELGNGCGFVLIRGRKAPVLQVCMDQSMLDVTDIPGCSVGDEVVLLGNSGSCSVSVFDWNRAANLSVPGSLAALSNRPVRIWEDDL